MLGNQGGAWPGSRILEEENRMMSLEPQLVKTLPAVWETWVPSLGWEDPLEKGTATHSRILAWRIPWTERSLVACG